MVVRRGYKQTEVGVIPEDWKCTTVGQLVREGVLEKPLDGNHGNIHPKSGDFVSFGIPFVMANNLRGGRVDLSNCAFIRKEQADLLQKGFSRPGDVLLTHKATIGNTAIVGDLFFEYIMLTPQVTYYRVADQARLSNTYLRQFFDSASFQGELLTMAGGGTRAYIGITAQLQLPVVLPPTKAEQEAIAGALSDADDLIESLEQLLVKKRQIKQGAMQELLTCNRRLSGFSAKWEPIALGQMGKCHRGVSYNPDEDLFPSDSDSTVRLLRSNNVQEARIVLTGLQFVNSARVSADQCLRPRDVLICMANGSRDLVGKAGRFSADDGFSYTFGAFMGCFRPSSHIAEPDFVFYLFQTEKYRAHVALLLAGSSINNLSPGSIEALTLHVPTDRAEQSAIANILSDIDAEIAALEAKLTKARQLKQGMMQELLTGRIRLV